MVSSGFLAPLYLLAEITECLFTFVTPSTTQSLAFFLSNLHSLQIQSITSPHWSFLAVTRYTSSPLIHKVVLPEHLGQSRCASTGFVNHTRFLNLKVRSVK